MPTRIPKHGVVNLFSRIKKRWTCLFAVPVFLIAPLSFSWNAFADDTLQAPLIIRVGAYENRPKI
jgi:hypothetical protein